MSDISLGNLNEGDMSSNNTVKTDKQGRPLVYNPYYNRWEVNVGQIGSTKMQLVASTEKMMRELGELGYKVAICSGTLLAAVRENGKMMEHDVDADMLVYSEAENVVDLCIMRHELKRDLDKLGYSTFRHTDGHLSIYFTNDEGIIEYFIDIFTGFFREGYYCQPFALRSNKIRPESIYPFKEMEFEGKMLPAPRIPEDWLSATYGDDWMIPNAGFRFEVPVATFFRFGAWFFRSRANQRMYWETYYANKDVDLHLSKLNEQFLQIVEKVLPSNVRIIDLACGEGLLTKKLKDSGYKMFALDNSFCAVHRAGVNLEDKEAVKRINLSDPKDMFYLATDIKATENTYNFISTEFHSLDQYMRKNIYALLNRTLQEETCAIFSFATEFDEKLFSHEDSTTWHYDDEMLQDELKGYGLAVTESYVIEPNTDSNKSINSESSVVDNRKRRVIVIKKVSFLVL
jgi:hypothetical protein